ncbi:MAG TPA: riboflavin synthase [Clostridiales bacterium]|nr:riboflavin synthase [Clostridiales bacterium]
MFTGLIEEIGRIQNIIHEKGAVRLVLSCHKITEDMKVGDSISVNGICLTVTNTKKDCFWADVMPETLRKTNLGRIRINTNVNLERALKLTDRFGGHFVSGHIDCTGTVTEKWIEDNAVWLAVTVPQSITGYIVSKGSIAVDGTSLTVAYVDENCFKVSLTPLTAQLTTLTSLKAGDLVNIECDIIGKYIKKQYFRSVETEKNNDHEITLDLLEENGFI